MYMDTNASGITDHGSYSNLERIIESTKKDCELAEKYWDIIAVPGIELTNIPAASVDGMAKSAKELGCTDGSDPWRVNSRRSRGRNKPCCGEI